MGLREEPLTEDPLLREEVPKHEEARVALLTMLVEAHRNVPANRSQEFLVVQTLEGDYLVHSGLPRGRVASDRMDFLDLAERHMVACKQTAPGITEVHLQPSAFARYEEVKTALDDPALSIESELGTYLHGGNFKERHPDAYLAWREAQQLLWRTRGPQDYARITALCRDAMDMFTLPSMEEAEAEVETDVVTALEEALSDSEIPERELLVSLLDYWQGVTRTAETYPHMLDTLAWENMRRLVFNTAFVMFELDRAFELLPFCIFCPP